MISLTMDSSMHPCVCPICAWSGFGWAPVMSGPSRSVRKLCPNCESYPRDRILWHSLSGILSALSRPTLRVLEFGGAARSYWWKRRRFEYHNVDLKSNASETVDCFIYHGKMDRRFDEIDVAIVSHVFGDILSLATRSRIISEAARATTQNGYL